MYTCLSAADQIRFLAYLASLPEFPDKRVFFQTLNPNKMENLTHTKLKEVTDHEETKKVENHFDDLVSQIKSLQGISPEDRDDVIMEIAWLKTRVSKYANAVYVMGKLHGSCDEITKQIQEKK